MDEHIILELEGKATPEQLARLRRWRQEDAANEQRYRQIRAVWSLTGLRDEIPAGAAVPSPERILQSARHTGSGARASAHGTALDRHRWLWKIAGFAAVLLVVLGIGYVAAIWSVPDGSTVHFRTGPGELTTAVLDDGTVVRLGPETTLEADVNSSGREIHLDGRAFFAVAEDTRRPFLVHTDAAEAQVLGTRFEVNTQADRFRLLVLDGRVAMLVGDSESELGAGELGDVQPGANPVVTRVEVPEQLLDWMGAWAAFTSTPLAQVARELEVRLGVKVRIDDPDIAERTITGWFAEEDQDHMVGMICRVANVRCTTVGDVVHMEAVDDGL